MGTFICTFLFACGMANCGHTQNLSKKEWLENLAVLENAVYGKHVRPFWKYPKADFERRFDSLRKAISQTADEALVPEKITTGFAQILALTGDGHSGVSTKSRAELFGLYKYNVSWFPEGLFISRIEESKKDFLGGRVLKIDDTPIEAARQLVSTVSTSFHEQGFKRFSPRYLESPGVLYGLGIARSAATVTLTVQKLDGQVASVNFERTSLSDLQKAKLVNINAIVAAPLPISRQPKNQNYWFDYLPDSKLLYLQYAAMQSSKDEPLENFVKRLDEKMKQADVDKFVLDLRMNPGGNQFSAWPLFMYLMGSEKVNQRNRFFVVTSHNTFSAATAFVMGLDARTHAMHIGTATADSPVYPAEDNTTVLPNCKMEVRLSSEIWNYSFADDNRSIVQPEITVEASFKDFIAGRDPVLEAIIAHKPSGAAVSMPDPAPLVGRYRFGPDNTLRIVNDNGALSARVMGKLNTALLPVSSTHFRTEIQGLEFMLEKDGWKMQYSDGQKKVLKKMGDNEFSAVDFILNKQYDEALKTYAGLQQAQPDNVNIQGTTLAGLSYYLFVESKDINPSQMLLKITTQLDPNSQVAKNLVAGMQGLRN